MNKKAYYRAIIKKSDFTSEFRKDLAEQKIKIERNKNEFKIFLGHVEVGSLILPVLFLKFIDRIHNTQPDLAKYPEDEAYKYVLDGILSPAKREALEQLQKNFNQVKAGTFEAGEKVHFDTFTPGRVQVDVENINKNMPLAAKYLSMKPALLAETQGQQDKKPSLTQRLFGKKPSPVGTVKSQSRIIRKKIVARAKANRKNRRNLNG
jgi:hypothetical protein